MKKLPAFFLLLALSLNGLTQKQFEFSFCNTLSTLRMYKSAVSEDKAEMEGGTFDLYRNSLLVNINQAIQYRHFLSYGLCYSINRYDFLEMDAGMSAGPKAIPYDNHISHQYQSLAPFIGFKTLWINAPVKFYMGLNIFPQFVWGQKGHYYIDKDYGIIENAPSVLSHIDYRINISMQFGNLYVRNFIVTLFAQPPAIYLTDVIKEKIVYLNVGLGLGWTFNISKISNDNE